MLKNRIENHKNEKHIKDLKSSFQKLESKAIFSLDKIKRFINKRNYNNSLLNSSLYLTNLKKLTKKKLKYSKHNSHNIINEKNSSEDKIKKINNNSKILSIKNITDIFSRNITPRLKNQKSEFDLPKLSLKTSKTLKKDNQKIFSLLNSKIRNNLINFKKSKKLIFPNEIMDSKDLYKNQARVIKIASFWNKSREKELFIENPKILDIKEMNSKFNLNLNLGNIKRRTPKIFKGKRYTILGMLNKLYHYYASDANNDITYKKIIKDNYYENSRNFNNNDLINTDAFTEAKSIRSQKNIFEHNISDTINTNINSDYSNIFLTKLSDKDYLYHKRNRKLDIDQIRRNLEIINNNSKININWLNSRNNKGIAAEKILYKYLSKTLWAYGDDPSYLRIKKFDKILNKILKKNISF